MKDQHSDARSCIAGVDLDQRGRNIKASTSESLHSVCSTLLNLFIC